MVTKLKQAAAKMVNLRQSLVVDLVVEVEDMVLLELAEPMETLVALEPKHHLSQVAAEVAQVALVKMVLVQHQRVDMVD